jgi:hypothetical protein
MMGSPTAGGSVAFIYSPNSYFYFTLTKNKATASSAVKFELRRIHDVTKLWKPKL